MDVRLLIIASEATWVQQHNERMDQVVTALRAELAALRQAEEVRGQAAVAQLAELQSAVTAHLSTLGTALEAPITRLIETASQAPKAAAEVIGQLRQEISVSVARDNALLEERTRIMDTLSHLLDAINHASTEQRSVIDNLVSSSAATLNQANSQFIDHVRSESAKLGDIAAQVTASAVDVASLGETFAFAVRSFNETNEKLMTHLQRIEQAMDKSMTRSDEQLAYYVAQARELIEISRANNVFLMEAMWTRCLPIYDRVREWLDDGRIGEPRFVTSNFCTQPAFDPLNRRFNPDLAGGGLLDLGIYNLAVSQLVMGRKPDKIAAVARFSPSGVDDLLSASLHYENGRLAQFTCGMISYCENFLMIGGEKGFIRVPTYFVDAAEAVLTVGGHTETAREPLRGEGFEFEIEEAMRCLRAGEIESPKMPLDDTLATMEVMDEIRAQIGLRYPGE